MGTRGVAMGGRVLALSATLLGVACGNENVGDEGRSNVEGTGGSGGGGTGGQGSGGAATSYESADPSGPYGNHLGVGGSDGDPGAGAGGVAPSAPFEGQSPGVVVGAGVQAARGSDMVQLVGGRLYVATPDAGLTILDVSDAAKPRLLGRLGLPWHAVHMHVQGTNVVLVTGENNGNTSATRPNVLLVDASDPRTPVIAKSLTVEGEIASARKVSDKLYVVASPPSFCPVGACNPDRSMATVVVTIDLAGPALLREFDRVTLAAPSPYTSWRSALQTDGRIYVAAESSTGDAMLRIIDIDAATGQLAEGATFTTDLSLPATVSEENGVLRAAGLSKGPSSTSGLVQAFRVTSSQEVTPLSRLEVPLVSPQASVSTFFDGARLYFVSQIPGEPVKTVSLADPAAPALGADVAVGGTQFGFWPRGGRLFVAAFDAAGGGDPLTLTAFDVTDLAAPHSLDRVGFGPTWNFEVDGAHRMAEAMNLFDSAGLIAVTVEGYDASNTLHAGVQLVAFDGQGLTLRGSADGVLGGLRTVLDADHLYLVGQSEVRSIDVADPDAPVNTGGAPRAIDVQQATLAGDHVVRLSQGWQPGFATLDVTSVDGASLPTSLGALDLTGVVGTELQSYTLYGARLFGRDGGAVAVLSSSGGPRGEYLFMGIDTSSASDPRKAFQGTLGGHRGSFGEGTLMRRGEGVVQVGGAIVVQRTNARPEYDGWIAGGAWLDVVDFSDLANPVKVRIDLPGDRGLGGLFVDGNTVWTSHSEHVSDSPLRARFYVDRIDVSNPGAPVVLGKINVPGSLVGLEPSSGRIVTVDYDESPSGVLPAVFKLVRIAEDRATLEASVPIDPTRNIGDVTMGQGLLFAHASTRVNSPLAPPPQNEVMVLSGLSSGQLRPATLPLGEGMSSQVRLVAAGKRALMSFGALHTIDATDPALPVRSELDASVQAWTLTLSGNTAVAALGADGARVVPMGE